MTDADLADLFALGAALVAALLAIVAYRATARTFRSSSGRPYGETVADLYRESERRGAILKSWAGQMTQRIDRQERR